MAVVIKSKSGKKIVLLNPAEKGKRYSRQIKSGKVNETGKKLKKTDIAFRLGYLQARQDNADCFKSKKKTRRKSTAKTRKSGVRKSTITRKKKR